MLFNSYTFVLLFLPVTLAGFFLLGRGERQTPAIVWLVAASLVFYGWWNPAYLLLISVSILVNFAIGNVIANSPEEQRSRTPLVIGIVFNLGLLGYFKYANFFVANFNELFDANVFLAQIVLPLAISFFTFQQIAYLVDTFRNVTVERNFLRYCLFVTFFPQLIAGPIVHHREVMPQFTDRKIFRLSAENVAVGLTIFVIGLAKKVIIADSIEAYSSPVFSAADAGTVVGFFDAWIAVVANIFHWYFDFSGYSDMALGLARLFGIKLPLNFNSPLKSLSMSDLFGRWHMTLSRFLRDYLYIPMGGYRYRGAGRLVILLITMFLCGLWHGASWNFIIWGVLCGVFLVVNLVWRQARTSIGGIFTASNWFTRRLAHGVTFLSWACAGALLGGATLEGTTSVLASMAGLNGLALPPEVPSLLPGLRTSVVAVGAAAFIAFCTPNAVEFLRDHEPALLAAMATRSNQPSLPLNWQPNAFWAVSTSLLFVVCLGYIVRVREFLYFQF